MRPFTKIILSMIIIESVIIITNEKYKYKLNDVHTYKPTNNNIPDTSIFGVPYTDKDKKGTFTY